MPEAKIRVLVVEDDLEQREDLVEWLESDAGHDIVVDAVDSGEAAFALLDQQSGDFDVVLLDQRLPGMDGIATMQRIKETFPVIPVIMFTEFEPKKGMDALRQGAYRYLPKPYELDEVTFMVRHASELRQAAQLQMQLRLSERLRKASQDLGLAGDVDAVLRETFDYAFDLVGDTTGLILSVEQDQHLRLVDCRGVEPEQRDAFNASSPKADKGSFGIVVQSGDIFESADTRQDRAENRIVDFGLPVPAKVINLPIKRGKAVAAILVLDTLPPTIQVREALIALADIAGIALERLFERATLTALYEMGQEFTLSQNVEQLLDSIVKWTREILGADAVVLYQYDSVDDSLRVPPKHAGLRDVETISQTGEYHRDNLVLRLIREKKPYYYSSDAKHDRILNPKRPKGATPTFVKREGIVSSGAVLLRVLDETVGMLFFNYRIHREFDAQERQKVQLFADQAAAAILNMRRYEREQSLRTQAETLREVAASISSETSIVRVAEQILGNLKQVASYTTASIQLIHGDRRKLLAASGFDIETASPWLSRPISEDRLVARVVWEKKPLVLPDTSKSELWDQSEETSAVRSWMGLPLIWGEDVIGILTLDHTQSGFFTEQSAASWMSFAQQAAIAIHNARLVERLQVLNKVGNELRTGLEQPAMFDQVVRAVVETLDCRHCTFFVLKGEELVPETTCVLDDSVHIERRFKVGEGLVGMVAETKTPILTRDAKDHPHFQIGSTHSDLERSMIMAPVLIEGVVFGVLSADQDRANAFNTEDLQMLETLAAQLAAAVQNGKLLLLERRRSERLVKLQQATQIISRAEDLAQSLRLIAENAVQLVEADTGVIHLIDAEELEVVSSYEYPRERSLPTRFSQKSGLTWEVYNSKKPIRVLDVLQDRRVSDGLAESGVRSLIGIPLLLDDAVIGVLFLNSTRVRIFDSEEEHLLMTLAERATLLADRLRRYEQRIRDITALEKINKAILEGKLDQIPQLVTAFAKVLTGADYATVRLIDVTGQFLELKAGEGYETKQEQLPLNEESFSGWVAITREGALCPSVAVCEHYVTWRPQVQSCMAVPLKQEGVVVGTLYVESMRLGAYSQQYQLDLLQGLADQAALALQIAELYSRRQKDLSALQVVNEAVIRDSREEILELVVKTAVNNIPGQYGGLWLHDSVTDDLVLEAVSGPADVMKKVRKGMRIRPGTPSINRDVFTAKEPRITPDVSTALHFHRIYDGAKSAVTVPLMYQGEPIGILNLESTRLNAFDESHMNFLDTLSDQAAIAIVNARSYSDSQDWGKRLEKLQGVATAISAESLSFKRVIEIIELGLAELYPNGIFSMRRFLEQELEFGTQLLTTEWAMRTILPPRDKGTTQHLLNKKKPLYIPDTSRAPEKEEPSLRAELIQDGIKSAALLPLIVKGQLVGKLSLYFREQREFSDKDRRILQLFAEQAAAAMERARIQQAQVEAVSAISASISTSKDQEGMLKGILDSTLHLMREASLGEVRLLEGEDLVVVASHGEVIDEKYRRLPKTQGITGRVATTGKPALLHDVREDDQYAQFLKGTRSELAVPLKRGAEVIGVLNIEHPEVNAFTEDDLKLAEAMAALATVAITNSELYQETQRALARTQTLGVLGGDLADLEVGI
ncbi:MAG: GAF domain-containing protein [Anaerolineae bacterium]|jgi:GAF domain-containing protein/FixJ family two-component response regulator|nr:GAF domain-containing protein [Anaerolineae bacterium]